MSLPTELPVLLDRSGFSPRIGADQSALSLTESKFGVQLPNEFAALWAYSNGAAGKGIDLLSLSSVNEYSEIFAGGFGYVPFTECNDSNPYVICCREPLRGFIAHVFHDDEPTIICRSLGRFLGLIAEARNDDTVDRIEGDFAYDSLIRTAEDTATATELVRVAGTLERGDLWRSTALYFSTQLFGPGQEDELANVLALGDEHTRDAVRKRWASLGTEAASQYLRDDAASYQTFLTELNQALNDSGIQTEPYGNGEFRLLPGRIGLNFRMLFVDCRRPGALAEWVQRFKSRLDEKR